MKNIFKVGLLSIFLLLSGNLLANKTTVTLKAPEKVKKGTEVTIKIEVKHIGNSGKHYTDWVVLKINGKEYKKWEFTPENLPSNQNFDLEIKVKAEEKMEIVAEGNCNKHGSKGADKLTIVVE